MDDVGLMIEGVVIHAGGLFYWIRCIFAPFVGILIAANLDKFLTPNDDVRPRLGMGPFWAHI